MFQAFKTTFKKERDGTMVRNNYSEPNKVTLARWVNKALDQALSKNNIRSRFKVTLLWTDYKQVENYKTRQALLIH
jgi:hypothetical protein